MLANGYQKQRHLCRGCGSATACSAYGLPAHIFAITFTDAESLLGADTLCDTTKGDGRLLFGGRGKSSSCGVWLSRGLAVRTARIFDGWSLGETPKATATARVAARTVLTGQGNNIMSK